MAHPHVHAQAEQHKKAHALMNRTGYKHGGGISMKEDERQDEADISKGVHLHESALHRGEPKTKIKLKSGGGVDGEEPREHLGRRARGGPAGRKGTHVNVIVAPQGGGGMHPPGPPGMPAQPMMPPRPPMGAPPMGAPPVGGAPMGAPPPPRPPGVPPTMGGGMMPPGGGAGLPPPKPPGMMKRGGGIRHSDPGQGGYHSRNVIDKGGNIDRNDSNDPMRPPQTPAEERTHSPGMIEAGRPSDDVLSMKRGGAKRRAEGGRTVDMEAGAGSGIGRIEKMHEYGEGGFKPKKVPLHA